MNDQQTNQSATSKALERDRFEIFLLGVAALMLIMAALLAAITTYQRLAIIQRDVDNSTTTIPVERVAGDPDSAVATTEVVNAAAILERAEDSVNSVDLLLSFLEGASVLVAVGLGAAAFYGIRQSNQLRADLDEDYKKLQKNQEEDRNRVDEKLYELREQQAELAKLMTELREYEPKLRLLDSLQEVRQEMEDTNHDLKQTIDNVSKLLQADQEFRVRNHPEAYRFIQEVLDHDPDNPLALYMAGWIETHFITGKQEQGMERLVQLLDIDPKWPSANAAYGVSLRRKAMRQDPIDTNMLEEAQGYLRIALGRNSRLVDYNQESFWGPLGGLLRDMGKIDEAIDAYNRALRVTPGSSYPQGNLATLLLQKAQQDNSREKEALDAFQLTVTWAQGELGSRPNDYFLMMDLAQAYTVLGRVNRSNFTLAENNLMRALNLADSGDLMNVSMRGWHNLAEYAPRRVEWNDVRAAVQDAIGRIEARLEEIKRGR